MWIAAIAACAALSPPALHGALAAVAGTLFEAAPFVLAAGLLPGKRSRVLAFVAGCGCRGGPLPGALALPAAALCADAFGWPVVLARACAALALRHAVAEPACTRGSGRASGGETDGPLGILAILIVPTFAIAMLREGVLPHIAAVAVPADGFASVGAGFGCAVGGAIVGIALGTVMPCATAGVAVAAGLAALGRSLGAHAALHVAAPAAAFALLATSGVLPTGRWRLERKPRTPARHVAGRTEAPATSRDRVALVALALLLGYVAVVAPSGLVSPRLRPLVGLGALAALAHAFGRARGFGRMRREDDGRGALVPLAFMVAALVCGAPVPTGVADGTTLERAYPGEALAFVGTARRAAGTTLLERATISCCRIDATLAVVALDRPLAVPPGVWIDARGTIVRGADGRLRLHARTIRRVPPPPDPFAYR